LLAVVNRQIAFQDVCLIFETHTLGTQRTATSGKYGAIEVAGNGSWMAWASGHWPDDASKFDEFPLYLSATVPGDALAGHA
jgi:hypothetical protein